MKKNMLTALCGLGLMAVVAPAHAYTYNFNSLITNKPGAGPEGWNVIMNSTDNQNWTISVTALGGASTPLDPANNIQIFFSKNADLAPGGNVNVTSGTGSTNAGGAGNLGGAWGRIGGNFSALAAPTQTDLLVATGQSAVVYGTAPAGTYTSNTFTGSFGLANNLAKGFRVSVSGVDGFLYSSVVQTVAPEMPGAALLLVALLPLGFAVRKHMGTA